MSKDFATLMAQVIPVLLLAIVLQTNQTLQRLSETRGLLLKSTKRVKDSAAELVDETLALLERSKPFDDPEVVRPVAEMHKRALAVKERAERDEASLRPTAVASHLTAAIVIGVQTTALALLALGEYWTVDKIAGNNVPRASGRLVEVITTYALAILVLAPAGTWVTEAISAAQLEGFGRWKTVLAIAPMLVFTSLIAVVAAAFW